MFLRALLLFCLCAGPLWAAQPSEGVISYDAFGKPEQALKVVKPQTDSSPSGAAVVFPSCDDPALTQQVQALFAATKEVVDESLVERRRRLLALKNIRRFEPLPVSDFRPNENYEVANILITTKINDGLTNADFKLCGSDNPVLNRRVYLLMQPSPEGIKVNVINYQPGLSRSFTYQNNKK